MTTQMNSTTKGRLAAMVGMAECCQVGTVRFNSLRMTQRLLTGLHRSSLSANHFSPVQLPTPDTHASTSFLRYPQRQQKSASYTILHCTCFTAAAAETTRDTGRRPQISSIRSSFIRTQGPHHASIAESSQISCLTTQQCVVNQTPRIFTALSVHR